MKTEKVECDGCGADLTTRTNIEDYRLVLASESKPGYGAGVYTCMGIYPAIDRSHHFCNLPCLDHWSARRHHRNALSRDWWEKWKAKHGTEHKGMFEGGKSSWSYPVPPDDVQKARDAEHDASALVAYPIEKLPR
jgi:hypothetical protein